MTGDAIEGILWLQVTTGDSRVAGVGSSMQLLHLHWLTPVPPERHGRLFVWAETEIVGDTVVVSSPAVKDPQAVRYAWATNPKANLVNRAGLPASPFRTDEWEE